jgi:hypothetical protein
MILRVPSTEMPTLWCIMIHSKCHSLVLGRIACLGAIGSSGSEARSGAVVYTKRPEELGGRHAILVDEVLRGLPQIAINALRRSGL